MKRFRKAVGAILAAGMVLSVLLATVACQSGRDKWKKFENTEFTELYIGGIGPLTGDYANYGLSAKKGAEIAVDEINEQGVAGFKLRLQYEDSAGKPDSAVAAYGKLMDKGMKVSLGAILSGENASVVAAAKDDGILLISPSASSVAAIEGNDRAFRICFSDPAQGTAAAKFVKDHHLAEKIAVFYASDNDYCKGLYDTFKAEAERQGLQIVEAQSFTDTTKTDFSAQIGAIKASGAKLVFLPIYAADAATLLTQAKGKLNSDVIFFGCDGLDGLIDKIGNAANAEGVMMLTPFAADATEGKVPNFVEAYKKANKKDPDQFAADGYDAVYAIVEALKATGFSGDPNSENYVGKVGIAEFNQRMADAMTKITLDGVTGSMTWKADGNTEKPAMAMVIKDGAYKAYADSTAD